MAKENLIHVKLEYEEARQSKRDILLTEASLLKIARIIKTYKELRVRELELKGELKERFEELRANIRATRAYLPILKMPKLLEDIERKHEEKMERLEETAEIKKQKEKKLPIIQPKKVEKQKEDPLEAQLREIQEKLGQLG